MNSLKHSRSYYQAARSLLPDTGKSKNAILSQLKSELDAFAQDYPNAAYSDFITRFGTPEDMAATYVENMDTMTLVKNLHYGRKVFAATLAVLLVILISWGSIYLWKFTEFRNDTHGTYFESPAHDETDDYSWGGLIRET